MRTVSMHVKSRKVEQGQVTRAHLIDTARELFGTKGFSATSLDEIARTANVTKGALYHHFSGKDDLFRAVFEAVKRELSQRVGHVWAEQDVWESLVAGCTTFIDLHTEPRVRQIVLLDARSVLRWEDSHDIDAQWGAVMLRGALRRAMNREVIERLPLATLAMLITGALTEACLLVANAENPAEAKTEATATVVRILHGLRVGPGSSPTHLNSD